jgi:hypothetical protein
MKQNTSEDVAKALFDMDQVIALLSDEEIVRLRKRAVLQNKPRAFVFLDELYKTNNAKETCNQN